jgi:Family of unknown function (DUF6519)
MKGDFTRDTFDPIKQYSRVLMQQGRVQLDADWNEQTSILLHYLRTLAADLLGPHAGPTNRLGFRIITPNWSFERNEWEPMESDQGRRDTLKATVLGDGDFVISAGRYYVQGVLVENHRPILYTEQVGYPFSENPRPEDLKDKELLVYLDVWERHVTPVEDERIREAALGEADTCTRAQVVWQVKVLLKGQSTDFDCHRLDDLLSRTKLPRLRARASRGTSPPAPCSVLPKSQYRGLDNRLYRVEVHEVGGGNAPPTFKWSRENGSVVYPIASLAGTTAVVASLGRGQRASLKAGDWVEVCDDALALREQSGPLARVRAVDRDELRVTLEWPKEIADLPSYTEEDAPGKHPLMRRWDHAGALATHRGAVPVIESDNSGDGWIDLEDGVQIRFETGGDYRAGDYWLIPARVATGDVEWPQEHDDQKAAKEPAARPPHGPQHYYAPLRYVESWGKSDGTDCRCAIEPLRRESP